MIFEKATVVDVDNNAVVVETVQQSTCGACAAQKGCGQGVLAKYLSTSSFFRVELPEGVRHEQYRPGDTIELGLDELAIVRASLWLYMVPIIGLVAGAFLGSTFSEIASIIGALVGLLFGGYLSSQHAKRVRNRPDYAPTLVADSAKIRIIDPAHPA